MREEIGREGGEEEVGEGRPRRDKEGIGSAEGVEGGGETGSRWSFG